MDVVKENVDNLTANKADIRDLTAATGRIDNLESKNIQTDKLIAGKADITDLTAATGRIDNLESKNIETDNLVAKKADIDLANVNNAWINKGVLKDGSIGSAAIHEGAVTNAKIADATIEAAKIKSINADSIVAGTIKTERLIITGPDGQDSIVKAINIANGVSEAEANGQKIQAASIDVVDLSAFQAKIAQFDMSQNAIYSGKLAINDPTSGVYISTTGLGLGDGALTSKKESPIQMYADGIFKLKGNTSNNVRIHSVPGNGNTNLYVKFATLTIVSQYINTPITFKLVSRGWETSNVQIMFKSINNIDPGLDWFRADGTVPLWIKKSGTSKWDLYMQKNEPWGSCNIYSFFMSDSFAYVTWTTDQVAAIPNGAVKVALLSADANAISRISAAETEISNNKKQIALKASQTEVTNLKGALGDLSVYTNKKTTMVQDITGWQYTWDTVISTDAAEIASHKDYITFDKGNIILGDSASASKLKLTKDSIQFKGTSDTAIKPDSDATAWITGKVFHINSGEIESSLKFGKVRLKPSDNNTLIIRDPDDTQDMAEFGSVIKIGKTNGRNVQIDTDGLKVFSWSNTIAHIGYGPANVGNNKYADQSFYTFGVRKKGSLIGGFSVAEGDNSTASGYCAHAEGAGCVASGDQSHAEGCNPIASGHASHAQGVNTVASGYCSCAGGEGSKTTESLSCAIGNHVIAASASQTVIGKYNTQDASNAYSLIIGNGGSDTTRSNALTVGWGGDITAPKLTSKADLYFGFAGGNSFRPYYTKGNSASFKVWLMGYTTSGMAEVLFFMPFSRPIIGASGVSVSSVNGLIIRQNNKYLYGSTATVYVKPSSYTSEIVDGGQGVNIRAKMPNTTNVTNNTACAITASIKITFS